MAESFLFNIAERVLEKLVNLSVEEARLAFNVDKDLSKLKETMSSIKDVLLDAERQQQQNAKLRRCMWKLRNIFYDAEDVIDDFKCEALRKQVANHPNFSFKLRFLTSCSVPLAFSFKMGHKIKEVNQRLDELKAEWNSFNLGQCVDNRRVIHRETHSFVDSSDVIGRDDDKENIIGLLMKPGEGRNIPVIPIVGIGGLGKTTLAQLVYNDVRVTRSFPLKIWICVSDEFDLPRLLKLIIKSIDKEEKCDDLSLDVLQTCLRGLLEDKKFLLVLDDVWNEDQARWIGLRELLTSMGGSSQSKIIVTTRSLTVASVMSSIPPYELKGLSFKDCLTLFAKWAFNEGDERQHPDLMDIGEDIVEKCKGVPLAVRTLGSLLFSKYDKSDWISIRDSEIWELQQRENDILPVLKLSYNHLPSHLQRCLALLSLYKKDHIYRSDKVVQLWMSNGLLEHPKQKQEWEDVGDRYLNELFSRCLVQKEEEDKHLGFGFTFKMHDLIHDLASDVSQKECKTVTCQTETVDENVRHLSFADVLLKVPQDLKKLKNVRTVIVEKVRLKSFDQEYVINLCGSNFKYLRALEIELNMRALPNSIGTLKHLRDLDLSSSYMQNFPLNSSYMQNFQLPTSFYKLRSLQRLSMRGICFMQIPDSVLSLIELRYLEITTLANHLKEIRPGCWPSLQYLGLFICTSLECLPEGMQHLTSLRRLTLYACPNLVSLPRSLKFLSKLEDLYIFDCSKINLDMEPEEEEDKDLQLSLKTFTVATAFSLTDLPRLLLEGSSSTLQQISIENCPNLVVLPACLQNLTSLRRLTLDWCTNLVSLPRSLKFLSRLEDLCIKECKKINLGMEAEEEEDKDLQFSLKSFSVSGSYALTDLPRLLLEGSSSTLQQISIRYCPNLVVLPAWIRNLTSLHKLEIIGCRELSIRCRRDGGVDRHKIGHIQEVVIIG